MINARFEGISFSEAVPEKIILQGVYIAIGNGNPFYKSHIANIRIHDQPQYFSISQHFFGKILLDSL